MESQVGQPSDALPSQNFDGSWERAHRNITAAACIGLLITGVLYVYAQSFLTIALVFLNASEELAAFKGGNFIERFSHTMAILKNPLRYSVVISQFLFMLLPTLWIIKRWHTVHVLSYVRVSRISFLELGIAVAATVCFIPVSGGINDFFMKQLNVPDFLAQINTQIFTSYSIQELLWLVVVVCITPALCEELLFRGYFQRTLERTLGMKSLFIAGIIFGLYHMQPLNLISLALLGCMFGFFFYRSKSLLPGIAAHFVNNLLAVLSLYKTSDGSAVFDVFNFEINFLGVVAALMFTGGLLFIYQQITQKNFEEQCG
jgi:membrane protease YdiL (CAAX protease family)